MAKVLVKGFTLIELMIALSIIGLLIGIVTPRYKDHATRAKVIEGFSLGRTYQAAVTEYYMVNGTLPMDNTEAGIESVTTDIVHAINVKANGTIRVIFVESEVESEEEIKRARLWLLIPTPVNGQLSWVCSGQRLADKYRPVECRGTNYRDGSAAGFY